MLRADEKFGGAVTLMAGVEMGRFALGELWYEVEQSQSFRSSSKPSRSCLTDRSTPSAPSPPPSPPPPGASWAAELSRACRVCP